MIDEDQKSAVRVAKNVVYNDCFEQKYVFDQQKNHSNLINPFCMDFFTWDMCYKNYFHDLL
jgi:hypothetical protein